MDRVAVDGKLRGSYNSAMPSPTVGGLSDALVPADPRPGYVPPRHPDASRPLQSWRGQLSFGYTRSFGRWVTVAVGAGITQRLLLRGSLPEGAMERQTQLAVGSVQSVGLRPLPLVRVHVSDVVSLDGHAVLTYVAAVRLTEQTYLAGATFTW